MKVRISKQREWSDGLLHRAIEFHGHGGPFIVLGLRMGLVALRRLDAQGWFDIRCRVSLRCRPPDSCVVDGIQCSTGCTMGKHNIEVEERKGIVADFYKGEEHIKIFVKQEVVEKIRNTLAKDRKEPVEDMIAILIEAPDRDLFEIF